MKIGIIGYGYVGKAMGKFFQDHYDVITYDPLLKLSTTKEDVNKCDVGVVCVPTPSDKRGFCDTSIVKEVIGWLNTPLIIIKSTVEPGTTDDLIASTGKNIIFSPEYCGESKYWSPYKFHGEVKETPFFIFGGFKKDTNKSVDLYMHICGPTKQYVQTSAINAELAKYIENCFYAMKVTFCYEIANICKLNNTNYNEVRELWLLDPRINPMHTSVFEENKKPFAGKCYPKDLTAMVRFADSLGYKAELLQEVLRSNERIGKYRADKEN